MKKCVVYGNSLDGTAPINFGEDDSIGVGFLQNIIPFLIFKDEYLASDSAKLKTTKEDLEQARVELRRLEKATKNLKDGFESMTDKAERKDAEIIELKSKIAELEEEKHRLSVPMTSAENNVTIFDPEDVESTDGTIFDFEMDDVFINNY